MIQGLIIIIIVSFSISTIFYFLGGFFLSMFKRKDGCIYNFIVENILVGLLFVISIYAVILTGFNSIFNIFLLGGISILFFLKKSTKALFKINLAMVNKHYLKLFKLFPIVIFFSLFVSYFQFKNGTFNILHFDEVFYTLMSQKIEYFGNESLYPISITDKEIPAMSYHYLELWFNSLIVKTFNINAYLSFSLVVRIFFWFLLSLVMIAIQKKILNKSGYGILAVLAIFISAITLGEGPIMQAACNAHQVKLTINSLFIALFIFQKIENNKFASIYLIMLALLNPSMFPITGFVLLFEFILFYYRHRKFYLLGLLIYSISAITFFLFYSLQTKIIDPEPYNYSTTFIHLFNLSFYADLIKGICKSYILYFAYFLPGFFLLGYLRFKNLFQPKKNEIILSLFYVLLVSIFAGIFSEVLFTPVLGFDSAQTNAWFNYMYIHIFIVVFYFWIISNIEHRIWNAFGVLMLVSIISYGLFVFIETKSNMTFNNNSLNNPIGRKSDKYREEVSNWMLNQDEQVFGGRLMDPSLLKNIGFHSSRGYVSSSFFVSSFLHINKFIYVYDLNSTEYLPKKSDFSDMDFSSLINRDYLFWSEMTKFYCSISPFSRFAYRNSMDLNKQKLEFIKKNNLKFIVVDQNVNLDTLIIKNVKLISKDSISGERFYEIK